MSGTVREAGLRVRRWGFTRSHDDRLHWNCAVRKQVLSLPEPHYYTLPQRMASPENIVSNVVRGRSAQRLQDFEREISC